MDNTYLAIVPKEILHEILLNLELMSIVYTIGDNLYVPHKQLFDKVFKRDFDDNIKVFLIKNKYIDVLAYENFLRIFNSINDQIYIMKILDRHNTVDLELMSVISVHNLYKIDMPMDRIINRFSVTLKYYLGEELINMKFILSMKSESSIESSDSLVLDFYPRSLIDLNIFWRCWPKEIIIKNLIFFFHNSTPFEI